MLRLSVVNIQNQKESLLTSWGPGIPDPEGWHGAVSPRDIVLPEVEKVARSRRLTSPR